MKSFVSFLLAIGAMALLCAPAGAQAPALPVGPQNVKINKIAPAVVSTPEYSVTGPAAKRSASLKWLEIEVEFEVDKIEIVDELTFKFIILFNGKLYTGDITHVSIPKGNDRYTVMYMSPRAIDRATMGKPMNAGMIENIWVTMEKQGQKLAEKALSAGKPVPNLQQIPGFLVPRSETPFSVLWWDRYEAVKSAGR